jgi:hypothetical protein
MSWGSKQIAGVVYDLSHLDGFVMDVAPKAPEAPTYKVKVSFGFHTFTRDLEDTDTPDLHFRHGSETRCFCTDRHAHSLNLPDMIRYAAAGRVYFSERENFLVVESLPGTNAPYVAFFNIEKATKLDGYDAAMFITSAHPRPGLPERLPAVTFRTLVDYRVQGKELTRPEPRKVVIVKRK